MVFLPGIDRGVVQWRAEFSLPGNWLAVAQGQQQIKLLGEELVVVGQGVAEQGKGLGERASAYHQLSASIRQQVEGDEVLEHAYRIGRAEHDDGTGELDRCCASGDGRKNDFGS